MNELVLHIMDIVYNSIRAKATIVNIELNYQSETDLLTVTIVDNGTGIKQEELDQVSNPFNTSRKTRKVGLGISLFELSAIQADGSLRIESEYSKYTKVVAKMKKNHIDCLPIGNVGETIYLLSVANEACEIMFKYIHDDYEFKYDTREVKEIVGNDLTSNIEVINWIKDYINENMEVGNEEH